MNGRLKFFMGILLICLPGFAAMILVLATGGPWVFPAVEAGLALNLAYCAWRGEAWAYWLLIFLAGAGVIWWAILLLAPTGAFITTILLLRIILTSVGMIILAGSDEARSFMRDQRGRAR